MALLKITLGKASGKINDQPAYEMSREFLAFFDVGNDEYFVLSNCGISLYDAHPSYPYARVLGISATMVTAEQVAFHDTENRLNPLNGRKSYLWSITVDYGPLNPALTSADGNPLNVVPQIRCEGLNGEKIFDFDQDGNPIVNGAGDPFDPPVLGEVGRCIVRVTRNEQGFNPSLSNTLVNRVNSAPWNGFPERTIKVLPISFEQIYSQYLEGFYERVDYAFEYNEETWDKELLDQGFAELGPDRKPRAILLSDGTPTAVPQLLDADGHKLLPPVDKDSIHKLTFKIRKEMDFSEFNMDDLFDYRA